MLLLHNILGMLLGNTDYNISVWNFYTPKLGIFQSVSLGFGSDTIHNFLLSK